MSAENFRTLKVHVPDAHEIEISYTDVSIPADLFDHPQIGLSTARGARIPKGPTLRDLISLYLVQAKHDLGNGSYKQRAIYLGKLADDMGGMLVSDLTPLDLEQWVSANPTWKSVSTRATVIKIAKRVMAWGVRKKQIRENPFAECAKPRDNERRPTTDEEFIRAVRWAAPEFRRVLYFMRWTSARPGEVRKITADQIDWEKCVVRQKEHKTSRTTSKPRLLALTPKPLGLVRFLVGHRKNSPGPLFLNTSGEPWTEQAISRYWHRLRRRAGIPSDAKCYGVRHQFGTEAIREGTPIKDVSLLMGHSSVTMTERYVHLAGDVEHLLKAAEQATGRKKKHRREPRPRDLPGQKHLF